MASERDEQQAGAHTNADQADDIPSEQVLRETREASLRARAAAARTRTRSARPRSRTERAELLAFVPFSLSRLRGRAGEGPCRVRDFGPKGRDPTAVSRGSTPLHTVVSCATEPKPDPAPAGGTPEPAVSKRCSEPFQTASATPPGRSSDRVLRVQPLQRSPPRSAPPAGSARTCRPRDHVPRALLRAAPGDGVAVGFGELVPALPALRSLGSNSQRLRGFSSRLREPASSARRATRAGQLHHGHAVSTSMRSKSLICRSGGTTPPRAPRPWRARDHLLVVRAVEHAHPAVGRDRRVHAPQVVVRALLAGGLLEAGDAQVLREARRRTPCPPRRPCRRCRATGAPPAARAASPRTGLRPARPAARELFQLALQLLAVGQPGGRAASSSPAGGLRREGRAGALTCSWATCARG
jgi:hypothetical protein